MPCWSSVKAVSGLPLCNLGKLQICSIKCNIARLDRQNRKFLPVLIITETKRAHFFVCKRTGFDHEELRGFVKMTLTRVSSRWLWLELSRVILWKTWLESSHRFSQRDSSRVTKNRDSSRVIDSNHAITNVMTCDNSVGIIVCSP